MNNCYVKAAGLVLAITPMICLVAPSAAAQHTFVCAKYEGRLSTLVKTKKNNVPVVVWDSTIFSASGYSPATRCQLVTQRFQNFHSRGQLKYLTAGQVRNQPVICATVSTQESCTPKNLLFTLRPGSSPQGVLRQLNNIRNRAASSRVVEESGSNLPSNPSTNDSVDMQDWLQFVDN